MIGFGFVFFILSALFSLAYLGFSIFTIVDCAQNEPSEGNTKITWILIILFGMGVGPLIYYFVRRPERIASYGR